LGQKQVLMIQDIKTEDIGDMQWSIWIWYQNLKEFLPNLLEWSKEDGESYAELDELMALTGQFKRYMGHATKKCWWIYDIQNLWHDQSPEVVPKPPKKDVAFQQAIHYPNGYWIKIFFLKINPENGVEAIKAMQDATLNSLLTGDRMVRLMETSSVSKDNYSVDELMTLNKGIFWIEKQKFYRYLP
jgi:hypothetical protein